MNNQGRNVLKKRLIALSLAASIVATMSGCSKMQKNNKSEGEKGYLVEDSTVSQYNGMYTYILDISKLESEKYNFSESIAPITFAKVVEKEEYGTTIFNSLNDNGYNQYMKIMWPECFPEQDIYKLLPFDCQVIFERLQGSNMNFSEGLVVIKSSMTAKRDVDYYDGLVDATKRNLKKGDNLSSIAIYYDGELVAFKQTGVGSDCENVINATKGDVEQALCTLDLSETQEISKAELDNYCDELNSEYSKKVLK